MNKQFKSDENVLVGTIADIKSIVLPKENPFINRMVQFEKMKISATTDLHSTIDFWIYLTEAAGTVFDEIAIPKPILNADNPFMNNDEIIVYLEDALHRMITELQNKQLMPEVDEIVTQLSKLTLESILNYGKMLLRDGKTSMPKEYGIFLTLALKIIYVKSALLAELPKIEIEKSYQNCPMCGDAPIVSVIDPMDNGLRYLICNLCETKWHKVRATCHNCSNTGQIELLFVEEQESVMKAESCPKCNNYIKHLDRTKNPLLDAYVEDLLTLSLDFSLANDDQKRHAFNLYLS